MELPYSEDMLDLLATFNRWQVQYLIVGGRAVNAYTEARGTKDLDIWTNPTAGEREASLCRTEGVRGSALRSNRGDFRSKRGILIHRRSSESYRRAQGHSRCRVRAVLGE